MFHRENLVGRQLYNHTIPWVCLGCLYPKLQSCLFKMPNKGTPDYFASLRYIWRKQLLRAYWRHKTYWAITDTITVYLFLPEIRCFLILKMPQTFISLISQPGYGTAANLRYILREQNRKGYTDVPFTVTIYRLMAKKSRFVCLGFTWRIFFLVECEDTVAVAKTSDSW